MGFSIWGILLDGKHQGERASVVSQCTVGIQLSTAGWRFPYILSFIEYVVLCIPPMAWYHQFCVATHFLDFTIKTINPERAYKSCSIVSQYLFCVMYLQMQNLNIFSCSSCCIQCPVFFDSSLDWEVLLDFSSVWVTFPTCNLRVTWL